MYFVEYDVRDVMIRKNADLKELLARIVDSGNPCVEIKDYPHKTANGCCNALRKRIKEDRLNHLKLVMRGDRIFVINTLLTKEV